MGRFVTRRVASVKRLRAEARPVYIINVLSSKLQNPRSFLLIRGIRCTLEKSLFPTYFQDIWKLMDLRETAKQLVRIEISAGADPINSR